MADRIEHDRRWWTSGDPEWRMVRCVKCAGTGWWYDPHAGLKACLECDAPQLSVTAKPCDLGDAWPVEQTVRVERVER